MDISNLDNYDVVVLVPIHNEQEPELQKTLNSFKSTNKLNLLVFLIIDGNKANFDLLTKMLDVNHDYPLLSAEEYQYCYYSNQQIDFVLIIKNENKGKFDSQLLFLKILKSTFLDTKKIQESSISVLMLDSDTGFLSNSIEILQNRLWNEQEKTIAAVTGVVYARCHLYNILETSQYYEYLITHILRKKFESALGTVVCLQGTYSLFKLNVLLNSEIYNEFSAPQKSILGMHDMLGEDRFLSVILLKHGYTTRFEEKSIAYTTVPANLQSFTMQRKRWNNSILSSFISIIFHQKKHHAQSLSWLLKCYVGFDLIIKFITPALIAQIFFQFIIEASSDVSVHQVTSFELISLTGILSIIFIFSCLFSVQIYKKMWNVIYSVIIFLNIIFVTTVINNVFQAYDHHLAFTDDQFLILSIIIVPLIVLSLRSSKKILQNTYAWICNIVMFPIFSIITPIYAYAHFDNFSWGNRNLNIDKKQFFIDKNKFFIYKCLLFGTYLLANVLYLVIGMYFSELVLNWIFIIYFSLNFIPVFFTPLIIKFKLSNMIKKINKLKHRFLKIYESFR